MNPNPNDDAPRPDDELEFLDPAPDGPSAPPTVPGAPPPAPPPAPPSPTATALDAYQTVADVATGVSLRKSDYVIQLISIAVCVVLSVPIALLVRPSDVPLLMSLVIGAILGVVVGTFGSGAFIGIYRLVQRVTKK